MKRAVLSLILVSVMTLPAWAGSFSFDFNDRSTQLGFVQKLTTQQYGDSVIKGRYLYNEDSDTNLAGIAGGVIGAPGNVDGLNLGIDVALNGGTTGDDQEVLAVGLGFLASYSPAVLRGFGVDGHLVYSPEIFTFMDADGYFDWGFGVSYLVLPNAKITLAFQNIQVDIQDRGIQDLDETVRFGIQLEF